MLQNAVETEPVIIANHEPAFNTMGYHSCSILADLVTIWSYKNEFDFQVWRQEILPHLKACILCAANRLAIKKWRERNEKGL